jgi:hypothetical protein
MLPVLYGSETWTLTLLEEYRLRVFEKRLLKKISERKIDAVTDMMKKLHYEELHNLYSLANIIMKIKSRRIRWTGHVASMGNLRNAYKTSVGIPVERE